MNSAQKLYDAVKQVHRETVQEGLIKDIDLHFLEELQATEERVNDRLDTVEKGLREVKLATYKWNRALTSRMDQLKTRMDGVERKLDKVLEILKGEGHS